MDIFIFAADKFDYFLNRREEYPLLRVVNPLNRESNIADFYCYPAKMGKKMLVFAYKNLSSFMQIDYGVTI